MMTPFFDDDVMMMMKGLTPFFSSFDEGPDPLFLPTARATKRRDERLDPFSPGVFGLPA